MESSTRCTGFFSYLSLLWLWILFLAPLTTQTVHHLDNNLPEGCSIKRSAGILRVWCPFVLYSDIRDVIPIDVTHLGVLHSDIATLNLGEWHLPRLQQLMLTNNLIHSVIPHTSATEGNSSLPELKSLFLGSNTISEFKDGDFETLPSLEQLVLSDNNIQEVPGKLFRGLQKLKGLNMDNNALHALPCGIFSDLSNILYITLSHNELTLLIPCVFEGAVRHIETLQLSHNNIKSIHRMTFNNLSKLKTLMLAYNDLSAVDSAAFEGLTSLETLSLEANHLVNIDNTFVNTPHLRVLMLSKNPVRRIESNAFGSLSALEELYLFKMTKLESMEKGAFSGLTSLTKLVMRGNTKLKKLSSDSLFPNGSTAPSLAKLHEFYLEHCGLTTLDEAFLKSLPSLEIVTVQGNPLVCDCRMTWIAVEITKAEADAYRWAYKWKLSSYMVPKCNSPTTLYGMAISEIPLSNFTCLNEAEVTVKEGGPNDQYRVAVQGRDDTDLGARDEVGPLMKMNEIISGEEDASSNHQHAPTSIVVVCVFGAFVLFLSAGGIIYRRLARRPLYEKLIHEELDRTVYGATLSNNQQMTT